MTEMFEDIDNDNEQLCSEIEPEEVVHDTYKASPSEARRRLERLLAERKLRDELDDYFDREL